MSLPRFDSFLSEYEDAEPREYVVLIIRFTRNWIHYGCLLHVFLFALVAAAQGMLR